jgi:hypothetical protein
VKVPLQRIVLNPIAQDILSVADHRSPPSFFPATTIPAADRSRSSLDHPHNLSADDANLTALRDIVSVPCRHHTPIGSAAYARVFLFTLEEDHKVVGRVVLPVRETVKTETEVASMVLVLGTVRHVLL